MVDMAIPRNEKLTPLLAEIGQATLWSASVDLGLVFILGALLAPVPSAGFAAELSAGFIYKARSFEQRMEIINDTFFARFYKDLRAHKNDNRRRSIEFIEKLKNSIFTSISGTKWIRNFAAHGSINLANENESKLVPGIYDRWTRDNMAIRKYSGGMTIEQVRVESDKLGKNAGRLLDFAKVIEQFIQLYHIQPSLFLELANQLAQDMKIAPLRLQDPREGPPLRKARAKRVRR